MGSQRKNNILFGVLNWGLGHATRSAVVIRKLLEHDFVPVLASDGLSLKYLRSEFPGLPSEVLPAYNVRYSRSSNQVLTIASQGRNILKAIKNETAVARQLMEKYEAIGLISDNRLGFWVDDIPTAYITHQLKVKSGLLTGISSGLHKKFLNKFDQCWVPDNDLKISGDMVWSAKRDDNVRYMGPLSSLQATEKGNRTYKYCFVLSGPEPQRSILENKILEQWDRAMGPALMVRGTDQAFEAPNRDLTGLEIVDFAGAEQLAQAINSSELIISRSGYSSIMDYFALGKKALLIPTPGQPEQEYLARYHSSLGNFHTVDQEDLKLGTDLEKALGQRGPVTTEGDQANWEELFALFKGKAKS